MLNNTNKKYQRSNANQVREMLQNHILEYFQAEDHGTKTNLEALKSQVNYMINRNESIAEVGRRLAEGGSLMIYNEEIEEFLNSLDCKLNLRLTVFEIYCNLISREVNYLYNLK